MDHETLFTATKWDILKALEQKPQSPLALAKLLGSSLANVSQQLRLLEMAGLVTSKRVSNRDKDKPRILYSLAGDLSYMIATSDNFVEKKSLSLSVRNKIVLRIWFIDDLHVRYALEKAFWTIEPMLEHIDALAYTGIERGQLVMEYAGDAKIAHNIPIEQSGSPYNTVIFRKIASGKETSGVRLYARKEMK